MTFPTPVFGSILVDPAGSGPIANGVLIGSSRTFSGAAPQAPFLFHQSIAGVVTSGQTMFTEFAIDNDTLDASATTGALGFYIGHTVNSGAVNGRTALSSLLNIGSAITTGSNSYYVSGGFWAQASAPAGGSAGFGNTRGDLFGTNPLATLRSGAGAYWNSVVGEEIDFGCESGTAAVYKVGLQIVQLASDAVAGTAGTDTGLVFAAQGTNAPGHDRGLSFGVPWGYWPIKSTGTLIGSMPSLNGLGPPYQAAYGVDFSAVTFSAAAFKSTGFIVSPTGRATVSAQTFGTLPSNFANDAAAAAGGIAVGGVYRNGSVLMVRVT